MTIIYGPRETLAHHRKGNTSTQYI